MVKYHVGDMFKVPAETLVNPVNCVGVMGKGLALRFKQDFPWIMSPYKHMCKIGALRPGQCTLLRPPSGAHQKVLLFATKDHWKDPSKLEWIESGLRDIATRIADPFDIGFVSSIAMPLVGCGLGGLDRGEVVLLIDKILGPVKDLDVTVCCEERK